MPPTGRDVLLSVLALGAGLAALGWFFLASPGFTDPEGIHMLALVLGGLVAFFGAFLVLNFLAAHRLISRLAAGRGVVARWRIRPEAMAEFLVLDRARTPANAWVPSRRDRREGAEVIFGAELMVLGSRFHALPTAGLQALRGIGHDPGPPLCLWLQTRSYISNTGRLVPQDEVWRIPVIDPQAANAAVSHFHAALQGKAIVAPGRWTWRLRIGLALLVILPLVGLYGWMQMNQPGVRTEAEFILPMTLTMLGVLGTPAVAIFTAIVYTFRRRQRGG